MRGTSEQKDKNGIRRVLDILSRWSDRVGEHFTQKRQHRRRPYEREVIIYVPDCEETPGEASDSTIITVWTRNLSHAGFCFVHDKYIREDEVIVSLCFDRSRCIYVRSKIRRRRQVHDRFWEYGAEFLERVEM